MTSVWNPENPDDLISRYLSGSSVKKLSDELGISRTTITAFLRRKNVRMRGRRDAERMKWAQRKIRGDYRAIIERQCAAAWIAATGRKKSLSERCLSAHTVSGRPRATSGKWVDDLFISLRVQIRGVFKEYAIGPYNVDLAIAPSRVAVEIQREHWKPRPRRSHSMHPERLEYILNQGWHVLIVYCPPTFKYRGKTPIPGTRTERFDLRAVTEKAISFCQIFRTTPSERCQYGMVDGYGKPRSEPRLDLYNRTRVEGF